MFRRPENRTGLIKVDASNNTATQLYRVIKVRAQLLWRFIKGIPLFRDNQESDRRYGVEHKERGKIKRVKAMPMQLRMRSAVSGLSIITGPVAIYHAQDPNCTTLWQVADPTDYRVLFSEVSICVLSSPPAD